MLSRDASPDARPWPWTNLFQAFQNHASIPYPSLLCAWNVCTANSALPSNQLSRKTWQLPTPVTKAVDCKKISTALLASNIYIVRPFLSFCLFCLSLITIFPHLVVSSLRPLDPTRDHYEAFNLPSSCGRSHYRMLRPSCSSTNINPCSSLTGSLASKAFSSWPHRGSKWSFTTATLSQVPFGRGKPTGGEGPISSVTLPNGRREWGSRPLSSPTFPSWSHRRSEVPLTTTGGKGPFSTTQAGGNIHGSQWSITSKTLSQIPTGRRKPTGGEGSTLALPNWWRKGSRRPLTTQTIPRWSCHRSEGTFTKRHNRTPLPISSPPHRWRLGSRSQRPLPTPTLPSRSRRRGERPFTKRHNRTPLPITSPPHHRRLRSRSQGPFPTTTLPRRAPRGHRPTRRRPPAPSPPWPRRLLPTVEPTRLRPHRPSHGSRPCQRRSRPGLRTRQMPPQQARLLSPSPAARTPKKPLAHPPSRLTHTHTPRPRLPDPHTPPPLHGDRHLVPPLPAPERTRRRIDRLRRHRHAAPRAGLRGVPRADGDDGAHRQRAGRQDVRARAHGDGVGDDDGVRAGVQPVCSFVRGVGFVHSFVGSGFGIWDWGALVHREGFLGGLVPRRRRLWSSVTVHGSWAG